MKKKITGILWLPGLGSASGKHGSEVKMNLQLLLRHGYNWRSTSKLFLQICCLEGFSHSLLCKLLGVTSSFLTLVFIFGQHTADTTPNLSITCRVLTLVCIRVYRISMFLKLLMHLKLQLRNKQPHGKETAWFQSKALICQILKSC